MPLKYSFLGPKDNLFISGHVTVLTCASEASSLSHFLFKLKWGKVMCYLLILLTKGTFVFSDDLDVLTPFRASLCFDTAISMGAGGNWQR